MKTPRIPAKGRRAATPARQGGKRPKGLSRLVPDAPAPVHRGADGRQDAAPGSKSHAWDLSGAGRLPVAVVEAELVEPRAAASDLAPEPFAFDAPQSAPDPAGSVTPRAARPGRSGADTMNAGAFLARLGGIVLAFRRSAGLTQDELADAAGVNVTTVQRLEAGEHECTVGTLRAVERALGVRPGLTMRLSK